MKRERANIDYAYMPYTTVGEAPILSLGDTEIVVETTFTDLCPYY